MARQIRLMVHSLILAFTSEIWTSGFQEKADQEYGSLYLFWKKVRAQQGTLRAVQLLKPWAARATASPLVCACMSFKTLKSLFLPLQHLSRETRWTPPPVWNFRCPINPIKTRHRRSTAINLMQKPNSTWWWCRYHWTFGMAQISTVVC